MEQGLAFSRGKPGKSVFLVPGTFVFLAALAFFVLVGDWTFGLPDGDIELGQLGVYLGLLVGIVLVFVSVWVAYSWLIGKKTRTAWKHLLRYDVYTFTSFFLGTLFPIRHLANLSPRYTELFAFLLLTLVISSFVGLKAHFLGQMV